MDYPSDFDIPTFPAGRRLAVSRFASIAVMVVFLLICVMCGVVLWARNSIHVHPFLVSVNNITGQWTVVGHRHGDMHTITGMESIQESVIGRFIREWFRISDNSAVNEFTWATPPEDFKCTWDDISQSDSGIGTDGYVQIKNNYNLYCLSAPSVYNIFSQDIVPKYRDLYALGDFQGVDMSTLQLIPISVLNQGSVLWQATFTIKTQKSGLISVLAYIQLSLDSGSYPKNFGVYVSEFNAYKMN